MPNEKFVISNPISTIARPDPKPALSVMRRFWARNRAARIRGRGYRKIPTNWGEYVAGRFIFFQSHDRALSDAQLVSPDFLNIATPLLVVLVLVPFWLPLHAVVQPVRLLWRLALLAWYGPDTNRARDL